MSAPVLMVENLVIGGGLAGSVAAMRLAAAGREVLLVEKEREAHHKVCGEFLSPEAVEYLHQAGIDPLRLGAGPVERLRFSTRDKIIECRLPFQALSVSRRILDDALLQRAGKAGCMVRRGACVESLSSDGDGWNASLSDGSAQRSRTVFLATGKHDLRGWKRPAGTQNDLVGFKLHWRLNAAETDALRGFMDLFLFPGGYGGLALVEGDIANLCLVVRRAQLLKLGGWQEQLAALCRENTHIAGRLRAAEPLWERPLAVSSIPYGHLCSSGSDLWCVGDQAAVIPSFTGDGMAIALHSGVLAADMYLRGETADQYQRKLRTQLKNGMGLATLLSRAIISPRGPGAALFCLRTLPHAIPWIAQGTRIPGRALLHRQTLIAGI